MTDNEIKKAMGCSRSVISCSDCDFDECNAKCLPKGILNLINRQKAEIERLKEVLEYKDICIGACDTAIAKAKAEAIKEFEKKSENILIELYEKYHKIANKPKKETDMFYQGRAEAIWECIGTNRNLVKEMMEDNK